jgi:hypothetical protein
MTALASRQEFQTHKPRLAPAPQVLIKKECPAPDPSPQPHEFPLISHSNIRHRRCWDRDRCRSNHYRHLWWTAQPPCHARAPAPTALPPWSRRRDASLCILPASAAVDTVVLLDESWDEVCWLKLVKRNEFCCRGLTVKSSIFPIWPMLSVSRASWPKETPRPPRPSRITAVKEQQCGECGRNVTSISVSRMSPDDPPRSQQSGGMSVSVACGAEGAGEGNLPSAREPVATLKP